MRKLITLASILMAFSLVQANPFINNCFLNSGNELYCSRTPFIPENLLYSGDNIEPINIPDNTLNAWLKWPIDNPAMQFAIVVIYIEPDSENPNSLNIAKERGKWLEKHFIEKGAIDGSYLIKYKIGEIAQAHVEGVGFKEK